jgi:hypothetical protein
MDAITTQETITAKNWERFGLNVLNDKNSSTFLFYLNFSQTIIQCHFDQFYFIDPVVVSGNAGILRNVTDRRFWITQPDFFLFFETPGRERPTSLKLTTVPYYEDPAEELKQSSTKVLDQAYCSGKLNEDVASHIYSFVDPENTYAAPGSKGVKQSINRNGGKRKKSFRKKSTIKKKFRHRGIKTEKRSQQKRTTAAR